MSFLTDLFEGNFSNLGTDISHAPSSLAAHPTEIAELAGGIALPLLGLGAAGAFGGADALGGLFAGGDALAGGDAAAALDAAATEGGPAAVSDVLASATPEELAAAAPDLAGADATLGGLGTVVGDSADAQAVADAYVAQDALGLSSGGAPGAVVDAAAAASGADVAPVAAPIASDAQAGSDVIAALDPNAAEASAVAPDAAAGAITPAAAPAAAPAASGGGLGATIGNALNSPITKAAELGLPLGFLAYNAIKGPNPIPGQAQQAVNNASVAAGNVPLFNQSAAQDLSLANQYQVTPGMQADLDTQKQNAYNQLYQQLANQGISNPSQSSQWIQGKQQIDQQIEVVKGKMVQQLVQQAVSTQGAATSATSAADATLMQAAQLQVHQDQAFQNSISSALQSFGMVAAFQSLGGSKAAVAATQAGGQAVAA